ncbi:MAG: alpha/beta hydrolase [Candidatus Aenigmarchaeota archaeon]|nr:alpha/beta hydrolase [Candidatus Aenigmarchaeota archaeon]
MVIMEESVYFYNASKERLSGFLHLPAGDYDKSIALAHCFTCSRHQKIMRNICDTLAESGFLVLRFDFSGNGESEGRFEDATYSKEISDLKSAISFLSTKNASSFGVLGHSMGAAVSILHSAIDTRVSSLCVVGSPAESSSIKTIFSDATLKEIYSKGRAEVNIFSRKLTMTKEFFDDAEKHSIEKSLRTFTKPFCVVHGGLDSIIPVENAMKLYSYAKGQKEIHIIDGADHMFSDPGHLEMAQKIILDWFRKTCH